MTVVGLQLDIAWEDKAANFRRVRELLKPLPPLAGGLIVLPEMFATGFSMNTGLTRQGNPPETEEFLAELAGTTGAAVVGGVVGTHHDVLHNEAVAFGPGGRCLARFAKIHPFSPAGEGLHYPAGHTVVTFDWAGFRIAPVVCYDLRFPELFRAGLDLGATFFTVIAQWPDRRLAHWTTLLQARAIENQAYVLGVNRAGRDTIGTYSGRSCLVNPFGISVADAGEGEAVLLGSADPAAVERWRQDFPAWKDRTRSSPRLNSGPA